jgi:ribosomal protein L37E
MATIEDNQAWDGAERRVVRRRAHVTTSPPSFTCPRCGRTSYHPMDVQHHYCGHCACFFTDAHYPRPMYPHSILKKWAPFLLTLMLLVVALSLTELLGSSELTLSPPSWLAAAVSLTVVVVVAVVVAVAVRGTTPSTHPGLRG